MNKYTLSPDKRSFTPVLTLNQSIPKKRSKLSFRIINQSKQSSTIDNCEDNSSRRALLDEIEHSDLSEHSENIQYTENSEEIDDLLITQFKSEIMIDKQNTIPLIIHTISYQKNGRLRSIRKTTNDLSEFDLYFRTTLQLQNIPQLPKRKIEYPLRDTALFDYFQTMVQCKEVRQNEYFKQFLFSTNENKYHTLKNPVISGELKKEGFILKNWTTKHCLVKNNYFIYFVCEMDLGRLVLPTVIDLRNTSIGIVDAENGLFKIELQSGALYQFKASSKELLYEWILACESGSSYISFNNNHTNNNHKRLIMTFDDSVSSSPSIKLKEDQSNTQSFNSEVIKLSRTIIQTHKEDTELIDLCKRLESIQFLDAIQLNEIILQLKKKSNQHVEDTHLLKLVRLLSSSELKKIRSRSRSRSKDRSRSASRTRSLKSIPSTSEDHSNPETPRSITPRSLVICRLCEAKIKVEVLAMHTYYCKILNAICTKQTMDRDRLKKIIEEIQRVSSLKRTDIFDQLIQIGNEIMEITKLPLLEQNSELKRYIEIINKSLERYENDICGYVFSHYLLKIITRRENVLQKYIDNPNNPRQFFNVLGSGIEVDESWNTVSLDDFEIIKRINGGAYSSVYLVEKKVTNDIYAMKIMKKEDMIRKNVVDGILAEKDILTKAKNRSVVKMYYAFQNVNNLFLVMEYCPGGDLRCLLNNIGCLDETVAKIYSGEIVVALEYLHSLGCIHRDLKPDNILIDRNGHLLLTDFGLSTLGSQREQTIEDSKLVCTPDYVAPESIISFHYSRVSDYFSLGCIIYEFVYGLPPFHAESVDEIFQNIRAGKYDFGDLEITDHFRSIVTELLQTIPEKRLGYGSIEEIKKHPWFEGIHWDTLVSESREDLFVPELENEIDTGYFESSSNYQEELMNDFSNENNNCTTGNLINGNKDNPLRNSISHKLSSLIEQFNKFKSVGTHHLVEENMTIVGEALLYDEQIDAEESSENQSFDESCIDCDNNV